MCRISVWHGWRAENEASQNQNEGENIEELTHNVMILEGMGIMVVFQDYVQIEKGIGYIRRARVFESEEVGEKDEKNAQMGQFIVCFRCHWQRTMRAVRSRRRGYTPLREVDKPVSIVRTCGLPKERRSAYGVSDVCISEVDMEIIIGHPRYLADFAKALQRHFNA